MVVFSVVRISFSVMIVVCFLFFWMVALTSVRRTFSVTVIYFSASVIVAAFSVI